MITKNLKYLKKLIYLLSFLCFVIQTVLSNNIIDFSSVLIIFLSNVVLTFYCFNEENFPQYAISSNIIFTSHLINFGGALYLKTIEFELFTNTLLLPMKTSLMCSLFSLSLIIAHIFYKRSFFINKLKNSLSEFYFKNDLIKVESDKLLIFLGLIALFFRFTIYDLNTSLAYQTSSETLPPLFRDIAIGFSFFIYAPLLILFSGNLYNIKKKNNNLIVLIFLICIFFFSLSINNRSLFFDNFLLIFFILLIYFQLGHYKVDKYFSFKVLIIIILSIPTLNFVDTLSKTYLLERSSLYERSPIQNFSSTFSRMLSYQDTKKKVDALIREQTDFVGEGEWYYNNSFFNRINILKINDRYNYTFSYISKEKINDIKKVELKKIISLVPQPIINIFDSSFDKNRYLNFSMASYIYNQYNPDIFLQFNIGSFVFSIIHYFTYFWPVCMFISGIFIFAFFDSLYHRASNTISPIAFIIFYTTAIGMLNIFTLSEVAKSVSFVLRLVPQTIILYYLSVKIFRLLYKKK